MPEVVDAKGLECPRPVIMARKALEENDRIEVLVDNNNAVENLKRLAGKLGCKVSVNEKSDGTFTLLISRSSHERKDALKTEDHGSSDRDHKRRGDDKLVIVISGNRMGRGNDELGYILIRSFIHTLLELDKLPHTVIFYNTGVKLTVKDSDVIDDLKKLEDAGTGILICGTCADYFEIKDKIGAGSISNMYDITEEMASASRLVYP